MHGSSEDNNGVGSKEGEDVYEVHVLLCVWNKKVVLHQSRNGGVSIPEASVQAMMREIRG